VQTTLIAAAALISDVDTMLVRRIGIDEHRLRRVRYFRLPTGAWRRHEPWMPSTTPTTPAGSSASSRAVATPG